VTPVRTGDPAPLLTLAEVKAHLRIDPQIADEDSLLQSYIAAVDVFLDGRSGYLGRCLQAQTWTITAPTLSDIRLPFCDATAAVITYLDELGVEQTLDDSYYIVGNDEASGYLRFVPETAAVALADREDAVSIAADFGPIVNLAAVKVAALIIVAAWYKGREGAEQLPPAAAAILDPIRWISL
jgi:hypothetical protein